MALLEIQDLVIEFDTDAGTLTAVDGLSLAVGEGEILAVVGESGSGKSVTALSILGLLPNVARVAQGSIRFEGEELVGARERMMRRIRGSEIGMVFQEPISALNPLLKVGSQISEAIRAHRSVSRADAMRRAVELLRLVQVPEPERRAQEYPHQFSGGMAQRVAIAQALANEPRLLIADEPTTALDVTVQAQVLETLVEAQRRAKTAMILITHDMGLVAEVADRVVVMYSGQVMEAGGVEAVLLAPTHPYTVGLLESLPRVEGGQERLVPIPGQPSLAGAAGRGCSFSDRCELRRDREICRLERPELALQPSGSYSACHFSAELTRT